MSTTSLGTAKRGGASRGRPNLAFLQLRIQAKLSRQELANLSGVSCKQVGLIERGRVKNPHMETLVGLTDALATRLERDVEITEMFPIGGRRR